MAYQPKSYRKFVATAATATLVASAMAPFASAASFTDVQGEELTKAVDFIVAQEIAQGFPGGLFMPADSVKRIDAAVMIAKALKLDTASAPASGFTDVRKERAGYVNALKAKGIVDGKEATKFGVESKITKNEMAKILVDALGLKAKNTDALPFTDVNEKFAPYVKAIVDNKIIEPASATSFGAETPITRGEIAIALYRGLGGVEVNAVSAASVVDNKTIEVTFDTALKSVDVKDFSIEGVELESATIKAAKAADAVKTVVVLKTKTELKLDNKYTIKYKGITNDKLVVEYKITTATKVAGVSATNLKQVVVAFDGTVDGANATDKDNYSIVDANGTAVAIRSVALAADGKSVTINLATGTTFVNQANYKLTVSNIKAGDKVVSVKDEKFTPVDSTLPTVSSVTGLGNKTIKVKFSEPVQAANASNFQIDGKPVLGNVSVSGSTVTISLYSALSNGEHTIEAKDVTDFYNFKSLSSEHKFNVVEDITAPTVTEVKATFETVTVTFSEPVDPATVLATSVYWMQGTSKKYPVGAPTQLSDTTWEFDFSNNKIQYATDLYVTGVKDYSNNAIAASTKVQVNPVVDQTRPEVSSVEYVPATKSFVIKFNKALDKTSAEKSANYVIKNSTGTEVSKYKTALLDPADNKKVTVTLVDALSAGKTYTLDVAGVSDNTTLKNVMMPFTKTITTVDIGNPNFTSVVRNTTNNTLVVNFNEAMSVSGDGAIVDLSKFFYSKDNKNTWKSLPAGSSVNVSPDGKSAIVQLPTSAELVANITDVRVQLVKDAAGNYLTGLSQEQQVNGQTPVTYSSVTAVDNNKLEVKFSRALLSTSVNAADFTVSTATRSLNVVGAALKAGDSTTVVLTLADASELNDDATLENGVADEVVNVAVRANATTSTVDGTAISAGTNAVVDGISADVVSVTGATNGQYIDVKFGETLEAGVTANTTTEATDFIITDAAGNTLVPGVGPTGYTLTVTGDTARINFGQVRTGVYSVVINPRFLTDDATPTVNLVNAIASDDAIDVYVADTTGPTVTGLTEGGRYTTVSPTFTEGTAKLAKDGGTAADYTSGIAIATAGSYQLKVTDANGNVTTYNFTIDTTAPSITGGTLVGTADTAGETIAASASKTLVFSELLSAAGKTAIENALKTGVTGVVGTDLGFAWNDTTFTLTITNNHASTTATFAAAANLTATTSDVAGNTSGALVLATY